MVRIAFVALLLAAPLWAQEPPLPAGALARVGSARLRHGEEICALVYSPDGRLLASADRDGEVQIHDAATGRLRHRLKVDGACLAQPVPPGAMVVERDEVSPAAVVLQFSADGKRLFAGARQAVQAFRVADGQVDFKYALAETQQCLAISPGLTLALAGESFGLRELDPANGRERRRRMVEDLMAAHAEFTPYGLLATGRFAGVRLIDAGTGKLRDSWSWSEYADISTVALAPDGKALALIAAKEEKIEDDAPPKPAMLVLWNARGDGKRLTPAGVTAPLSVAYAPDGKSLAIACREGLLFVEPASGRVQRTMASAPRLTALAFSADGRVLAGASETAVIQWDVATGQRLTASAEPADSPRRLRFLDSRRLLVFAGDILEYDWREGKIRRRYPTLPHDDSGDADVAPDGSAVAISDVYGLRVLDAASGRVRHEATGASGNCVFAPDGRLLLFNGEGGCDVFDRQLKRRKLFDGESGNFASTLSPDGKIIAGLVTGGQGDGGRQTEVRMWDSHTGAKIRDLAVRGEPTGAPAFTADGRRLAMLTTSDPVAPGPNGEMTERSGLALWDVASGRLVRELSNLRHVSLGLALSPDGRSAACGGDDYTVYVIEIATGVERAKFAGHRHVITALEFSPDGRYLASASADAPVFVWDLYAPPTGPAPDAAALCSALARNDDAFAAMQRLIAVPDTAVAFFRERIRPVAPIPEKRLRQLLGDLDHPRYADRARASAELQRLLDQAEVEMARHAASAGTSAEARRQIRRLLGRAEEPSGELVVRLRALEVLEQIKTPAARALLAEWAAGAPAARFTREARATLERMKDQSK